MHTVGTCTTQHLHDAAGAHAGALLVWVGWALVLGPASYLASYVPLLGGLVGCMHGSLDTWGHSLGAWGHSLGAWGHRLGAWGHSLGASGLGLSYVPLSGGPAACTMVRDGSFCHAGSASWPWSSPLRTRSRSSPSRGSSSDPSSP